MFGDGPWHVDLCCLRQHVAQIGHHEGRRISRQELLNCDDQFCHCGQIKILHRHQISNGQILIAERCEQQYTLILSALLVLFSLICALSLIIACLVKTRDCFMGIGR